MDSNIYAVRALGAVKHHTGTAGFTNAQKIEVSEAAIRLFEDYIVELGNEVATTDPAVETGPGA